MKKWLLFEIRYLSQGQGIRFEENIDSPENRDSNILLNLSVPIWSEHMISHTTHSSTQTPIELKIFKNKTALMSF